MHPTHQLVMFWMDPILKNKYASGVKNVECHSYFLFFIAMMLKHFSTLPRTFGSCHSTSVTMPVILYDGSEEELMDTIEREFS